MKITLYSSDNCLRCHVLKTKLDNANIKYSVVSDEEAIKADIDEVPILEADGVRMTFVEANEWLKSREE